MASYEGLIRWILCILGDLLDIPIVRFDSEPSIWILECSLNFHFQLELSGLCDEVKEDMVKMAFWMLTSCTTSSQLCWILILLPRASPMTIVSLPEGSERNSQCLIAWFLCISSVFDCIERMICVWLLFWLATKLAAGLGLNM